MQSRREDLRKNNNRNNVYLIIIAAAIVLIVVFGVIIYNAHVSGMSRAQHFVRNHFNPNVEVYGVKVGGLTVAAATNKVNRMAANNAVLEDRKVRLLHNKKTQTISQKEVRADFNKQHTTMPDNKQYKFNNAKLDKAQRDLTRVDKASVDYQLPQRSYQLAARKVINRATFNGKKIVFDKDQLLRNKLKQMNAANSTLKKSYQFKVPVGEKANAKTVTVQNKTFGWAINEKKARQIVENAFVSGKKTINGKDAIYGLGYDTYGLGYSADNHGVGDNYVVVSLKDQEIWVVRKNKVAVHLNDVVTGTRYGGQGDRTPTGVWYIMYKQSPSVLRGFNDDGSKYASKVQYWMQFTNSGCGLHDANWRTDWSKTAYLNGGSHGCVNIRPAEIKSVWDAVITHEAVVIY